jgi:hypothetical protein
VAGVFPPAWFVAIPAWFCRDSWGDVGSDIGENAVTAIVDLVRSSPNSGFGPAEDTMDSNTLMLIYGGLAILVIFYFVISFFSGKTWKIPHVLLAVLVFFATGTFMVLAAMTLKTHQSWREIYLEKQAAIADQKLINEKLLKGYARDVEGKIQTEEDSIRELDELLGQELYDRARVWRGCLRDASGSLTLTIAPPDDGTAAPESLLIPDQAILYAFKEIEVMPEGWKLPDVYLGEFSVTASTPSSVTLAPTIPLDQDQQAEIQDRSATWTLYELMPVDSYYAFADLYDPDAVDPEADIRAKIQELMPPGKMRVTGPTYTRLIDEYARDRRDANEGTDPPERIWKHVRFVKLPKPIKVDSDDESPRAALRYFDATGRAIPASLRAGDFTVESGNFGPGEIEFDIGDEALLDKETADKLIEEGEAEELKQVYIRELRDYAYEFHELFGRFASLDDIAVRIEIDRDTLVTSHAQAETTMAYRTGEKTALKADLERYTAERDAVAAYLAQLTTQWQQLRKDLSVLYQTNNALASQLARDQYNLTRMINTRTRTESTATAPQAPTPPTP